MQTQFTTYEVFNPVTARTFFRTRFHWLAVLVAVVRHADYAAEGEGWLTWPY